MTIAVSIIFCTQPSRAFQAQITPKSPALGDTVSLIIQSQTAPSVRFNGKTYPSFDLGNNRYRTLLPTTPLDRPGRLSIQVTAGTDTQTIPITLRNRSFPTQSIWLPPGKDSNGDDAEFDRVDAFKAIVSPEKLWSGKFLRPNQGEVSSGYGIRRYYNGVFAKDYYHRGIDYAGGQGSAIVAPAAGRVVLIGRESQGFRVHGNCVGLDHGQGVESIYIHMSRIDVKEGDFVKPGQRIGAVGATGSATGPHLHWGVFVHSLAVDPTPWRTGTFE
ncbi:peptidase M23 [Leptolyngbya boryana NIES-2135]|uniref:Peptidase M23 n=2 Tax=Leptolyngbya group TaxID=3081713 RepID=A0A1Z4JKX2_LEPBY|nr:MULTISPECIES: M23 family metallopeptidase [Leptolyngbya]BAY57323.1 peptidase M23 [Leptolyngbya boryana NIES-2135]MBD2366926.1 M23 family metallopeptidase [Leptolyngbya sp. FACHB-161]MBD2373720.1 M23 family metallopeptidase [Leptolyngbya sp. FACHB-238]MBD2398129.1 M23 family metallopeptidase [Leptolyngbya sp. FACHB-239]MBD2404631.1 M23 family metallopeptidase [Leptolyngbya sp. FACHB-402]